MPPDADIPVAGPTGDLPVGPTSDLPVDRVLPELRAALADRGVAVLEAPPGAGKTTRVPLDLLEHDAFEGRLVLLEPRRLAARGAARRLADTLGERVGDRVGLVTRDERRVSRHTRVEVVTDGVLLRRFQRDPGLERVGMLVFDEFHERRLESDLALAFALETRTLRTDLRLLVTSATLDGAAVARLLGDDADPAPRVRAEGRTYPVEVRHRPAPGRDDLVGAVVDAVTEAAAPDDGDVLVFLPGVREIADVAAALPAVVAGVRIDVRPLHGGLGPRDQDAALRPATGGRRRVVVATDVAETSLTVPGVVAVVDAGLSREPRLDPATGMSGLVTVPASRGSAEQRAGRAGRLAPGRCIRLWSAADHVQRPAATSPAIATEDLTGAALEVACWGADVAELALLDPPAEATWSAARRTLTALGALDDRGRPTDHGRRLVRLPLHPRLAHLAVRGAELGHGPLAADLAAILADRDPLRPSRDRPDADLVTRVRVVQGARAPAGASVHPGALDRIRREATRVRRAVPTGEATSSDPEEVVGVLVAIGWPDRVAAARDGRRGAFLLANGRGATLPEGDPLAGASHLAVAAVDHGHGVRRRTGPSAAAPGARLRPDVVSEARVHLAAAVTPDQLRDVLGDVITTTEEVVWEDGDVRARRRRRLGALVLATDPWPQAPPTARTTALLDGLRIEGLDLLGWSPDDRALQARLQLLHRTLGPPWSDVGDVALLAALDERVAPFVTGARRRADLARTPLRELLLATGPPTATHDVDRLAPTHLTVPSGSRVRVDYDPDGGRPVLAAKLQELFGATRTPTVVDGRVPVVLHLLSPARRPVQVTDDLPSFWATGYAEVRRELRGRYPKHPWPEDPTTATATARTRRRS